jgi:DNA-binding NarL/FixJ family response regulator
MLNVHFVRIQTGKGLVMQKLVALNENGRRVGQAHPRAKLLDSEVDQVLALLEAGLSYAEVAVKFDVSKSCIAHIATGRRRGQAVCRVVRVELK